MPARTVGGAAGGDAVVLAGRAVRRDVLAKRPRE
jgi:hypothetical protein